MEMQRDNKQLLNKLNDLVLIADFITIDKNFILGYIFRNIDTAINHRIKQSIRVAELVQEANSCQLISKVNFLELIVVLSHICSQKYSKNMLNLVQFYQDTIQSILYDNDHLKNKYFYRNQNKIPQKIFQPIQNKIQQESLQLKRNKSNIAQCPVCLVQIKHHNICVIGCGHIIHQECFESCMKQSILNKKFPLKCPFEDCKKHIETQDIQEYLPKQLIEKYYEFTLHNFVQKNTKNMSWCPTPGCSNAFQFDGDIREFKCLKCTKIYCLRCKTESHAGMTCEQNKENREMAEEDKQFIEFAKGAKYKQCPQCRFWVQKNKGCCHMTCRCGYEFCYVCGAKYGQCNCEQSYQNYYGSGQEDSDYDSDMDQPGQDYDSASDSEGQIQRSIKSQQQNEEQPPIGDFDNQ